MKRFVAWVYSIIVSLFAGWMWFKTPTLPTTPTIPTTINLPYVDPVPSTQPRPRRPRRTTPTHAPRPPVAPVVTEQRPTCIIPFILPLGCIGFDPNV